jgi:hypothetical protein
MRWRAPRLLSFFFFLVFRKRHRLDITAEVSVVTCISLLAICLSSIVEFASPEDTQRAIHELSEQPLIGQLVFIREVSCLRPDLALSFIYISTC